ncbi:glutamate--cysteine ligase [Haloferax sp. Atlit-47N]|uniref:glutamate-cysteine ligase family protein n=1 Tax=Haloferax sp. Atlit-47N TaxID=2077199 RepID=UPI000E2445AA|nr:glutamate-cysteine ligase family protein [Haloferax sp. Atlit-47N]RDZ41268.1 glutamate--cysteine ligase [Haloferax sp. Atlit-47N]
MSESASDPLRRSIEVEYWVVEEDGSFTDPGGLVDASPGAEREFVEPVLEVKTTPCDSAAELRKELYERLGDVLARAEEVGKRLVPLATPLSEEAVTELESDRTRIQNRVVGSDFQYARHCVGTHVHVEQRPGREIDQYNALVALDPALALVNSSPYYDGKRLAAGARSKLYRRMTYDDVPHQGRLWRYADDTREWSRRLERRFEEFLVRAEEEGVDRATIEANFDPESAIWTPVQLRAEFGTVEWRSPDCSLPSDALRLANSVADVVHRLDDATLRIEGETGRVTDDRVVLPEFDAVLRYVNAAIEDGLDSETVRSYLDRMGFDVGAYSPVSHEIDGRETVTAAEARELRLTHADRLERDVRNAVRQRE